MATTNKATTGTSGKGTSKSWGIPLIGHFPAKTQIKMIGGAIILTIIGSIGSASLYIKHLHEEAMVNKIAAQMISDSQKIAKNITMINDGFFDSFNTLTESEKEFSEHLNLLQNGGVFEGVSINARKGISANDVRSVSEVWSKTVKEIDKVNSGRNGLIDFNESLSKMGKLDDSFFGSARAISLYIEENQIKSLSQAQKQFMTTFPLLTQKMAKNVNALMSSKEINFPALNFLGMDIVNYKNSLLGLLNGSSALNIEAIDDQQLKGLLIKNKEIFLSYNDLFTKIDKNQVDLVASKTAAVNITKLSMSLAIASENMLKNFEENQHKTSPIAITFLCFLTLLTLCLSMLLKVFKDKDEASLRALDVEKESQSQQQAIMVLLDEIGELADGNLTVKATVNETFTGAIADSLNYTVQELRKVIQNVIISARKVGKGAQTSSEISSQLASSAQEQFDRLAKTGDSIIKMSMSMDDIAQDTSFAAKASRQSLEISQDGLRIVEETISRMNTIRDTIQDTSKKIKLLGESSTAIGEVTGLIRDITKQINILALNAAIQAASAGEAGRGFAVVAGEVQRLALSSEDAAKRIDDLVLTIQEDAKGAVSAMELSTKEVVEGAKLTDKAGNALKQIEGSVSELAKSIEEVTEKVEAESEIASNLSLDMRLLQEYTEKTVDESKRGAESVNEVKGIADELRESVSNFRV